MKTFRELQEEIEKAINETSGVSSFVRGWLIETEKKSLKSKGGDRMANRLLPRDLLKYKKKGDRTEKWLKEEDNHSPPIPPEFMEYDPAVEAERYEMMERDRRVLAVNPFR